MVSEANLGRTTKCHVTLDSCHLSRDYHIPNIASLLTKTTQQPDQYLHWRPLEDRKYYGQPPVKHNV